MYLKKIRINHFRNLDHLDLYLNKNVTIFIGNNAQGKTSILESIYVLALTKSSRGLLEDDLIQKGFDHSYISGVLKNGMFTRELAITLEKGEKTLKVNHTLIRKVSDYISLMDVIMFQPDDLDIIKKAPSVRRSLLNIELCQLYPDYMRVLNEYNKILKIRNELLKKDIDTIDIAYFTIVTEQLVDRLLIIMNYRKKFIDRINEKVGFIYEKIMKQSGFSVSYQNNIDFLSKEDLCCFYKENFFQECHKKMTLFGIHRDDLSFYLNDLDLKLYGSQGQQRIAILAFKLAEIDLFKEVTGTYPIVLLDDIFSEMDIEKRNRLLKFIKSNIQFIITTTDIHNISNRIVEKASIFKLKNGTIVSEGGKNERK